MYAVYYEMVSSDRGARGTVSPHEHLDDSRVEVYWNSDRSIGRWFDENVTRLGKEGDDRIEWDAFFLLGPTSDWPSEGRPRVALWGRTIHQSRDRLIDGLSTWEPELSEP